MSTLHIVPFCLDSEEMALARRKELGIPRDVAMSLGRSAADAARLGYYQSETGQKVDWRDDVHAACAAKVSISPDATLPTSSPVQFPNTQVVISNETTLGAAQRLTGHGLRPLALNFANGIQPGGGFLSGARAQEETLCRSSALYQTLLGDPMYQAHGLLNGAESSDWAIYSPEVPVFRNDAGVALERPWALSFLTCAAPLATVIGLSTSGDLLKSRILRVLSIARAYNYSTLVLGAWGCGAFRNDPHRTATDFLQALEGEFSGAFSDIVFAIADWSPDRKTLGPFRDVFLASDYEGETDYELGLVEYHARFENKVGHPLTTEERKELVRYAHLTKEQRKDVDKEFAKAKRDAGATDWVGIYWLVFICLMIILVQAIFFPGCV